MKVMEIATARIGCALRRLGRSHVLPASLPVGQLPRKLTLYEFEASPYCKRVREAVCALGLEVEVRPCPRSTLLREGEVGGSHFRAEARALLSPAEPLRFPLIHDRPTATSADSFPDRPAVVLVESRSIVAHLWECYGDGADGTAAIRKWNTRVSTRAALIRPLVPGGATTRMRNLVNLLAEPDLTGLLAASLARPFAHAGLAGARARAAHEDAHGGMPRELWAFESCPRARLVREALCSLELPYTLQGMGGAPGTAVAAHRLAMLRTTHGEAARPPFLFDPSGGIIGSGEGGGWEGLVRGLWAHYAGDGPRPRLWDLFL